MRSEKVVLHEMRALVRLLARQAAREFQTNRNSSVVVSKLHEPEA